MKYRSLDNWGNFSENCNLIYFAQLMEELLFDFSIDTYKPSAMNISLLCSEALETLNEIEKGNIKLPNLQHILDELCYNFDKDIVAQSLLKNELHDIKPILKNQSKGKDKVTIHDKRIVIELLAIQLHIDKYKKKIEELLIYTINGKINYTNVRSITRNYVTTLRNIGYSIEYIRTKFFEFFYSRNSTTTNNHDIKRFIGIFDGTVKEYRIIYKGTNLYEDIITANNVQNDNTFDIKIQKNLDDSCINIEDFEITEKERYIYIQNIHDMDPISAKNQSGKMLDFISSIFSLFHHKESPTFSNQCIVIDIKNEEIQKSDKAIDIMHKCIDIKPKAATTKMAQFIGEFGMDQESIKKFIRAAELHSLALSSDSNENKIINLWIALESIIPSIKDQDISNIENIIEHSIPCLCTIYYPRLFRRFCKDLLEWNRKFISELLKDIKGDNLYQKMMKLISLPDYFAQKESIKNNFKDYHLMKDRFEFFSNIFETPKNVLKGIENHKQRIEWQLRRIYRARNLIVHSGITPSYVDILITNLHDYLDIIFGMLILLATHPNKIVTIEQGFKYKKLSYLNFIKELKDSESFNEESLNKLFRFE